MAIAISNAMVQVMPTNRKQGEEAEVINKVIIGILIFLLVLTGALCAYSYNLGREINALTYNKECPRENIQEAKYALAIYCGNAVFGLKYRKWLNANCSGIAL